jgi:hypothetical protein
LPAYAAMWAGGALLRARSHGTGLRTLGWLCASLVVATSICFLVSNGSFYWLSDSVAAPSAAGWLQNLGDWYLPYLRTTAAYVGAAAVLHVIAARALRVAGYAPLARGQRG